MVTVEARGVEVGAEDKIADGEDGVVGCEMNGRCTCVNALAYNPQIIVVHIHPRKSHRRA